MKVVVVTEYNFVLNESRGVGIALYGNDAELRLILKEIGSTDVGLHLGRLSTDGDAWQVEAIDVNGYQRYFGCNIVEVFQ